MTVDLRMMGDLEKDAALAVAIPIFFQKLFGTAFVVRAQSVRYFAAEGRKDSD